MSDPILLEGSGAVWRLTLNRPETRNALSSEIVEAALEALDEVEREWPAGLIIDGTAPVFCAGLDLSGIEGKSDGDMLWTLLRIEMLLQRIWALPCRTLGLARKAAIGAGADILVACQSRALTPHGRIAFPGLGFGIFLGTNRLALRIGANAAERLLSAGRPVEAEEALSLELIHAVVEPEGLEDHAAQWAERVLRLDRHVASRLGTTVARADPTADMDALVRSAARPGLRDRIASFAAQQARSRGPALHREEVRR